ncbi:ubiquitin-like-specific protease 1D isoform X3 [Beta vulgaris subsp. vulgaris]|uniref:ubiquitin-like-specific protease 1D isoform X3 n=1 Tax=Beta vulgaris subsp. vulgaris TaxID=3555 RepID=UPI002036AD58|nr:ubiquitin-like-specific protease 1D isoform X3 [Beta vulgaris subsp. vulgaris]
MADEEKSETTADNSVGKKKRLDIDFTELLSADDDKAVAKIVVVSANRRRRLPEKEKDSSDNDSCGVEDLSFKSDHELESMIDRTSKSFSTLSAKLNDKGAKLKAKMELWQGELDRRRHRREQEVAHGCKKPVYSGSSNINGALGGPQASQSSAMSPFASSFIKKLEEDNPKLEQNTSNQASNAFDCEISHLNRCDKSKRKSAEKLPQSKKAKPGMLSKEFAAWNPGDRSSRKGGKFMRLNGKLAGKNSSTVSLPHIREKIASLFGDNDDSQALNSNGSNNEEAVVLVDEEEPELLERQQEAKELLSRSNEGKIYYPSREDPESLEIFRAELKCLEPGECLTSTIMNFYVRNCALLPIHLSMVSIFSIHTFTASSKRLWHTSNHWSLVIICIPDEEDESGPIILHLDSLGLHSSSLIFDNIKSLLKNERDILNEDVGAANVPISDRIWKNLPRRIEQKIITVPRQTNDYDCGLFVLYYMERFIQQAPERLRKQDLSMFGKNWFKPQEASSLRGKIKRILQEEFHKALRNDKCTWEPVSLSATAEKIDRTEIT